MNGTGSPTPRSSDPPSMARTPPASAGSRQSPGPGGTRIPPGRTWLWFAVALLVNFLAVRFFMPGTEAPLTVPYTLFKDQVSKHNVQSIYSRGETLSGRFTTAVTFPPAGEAEVPASAPPEAIRGIPRRGPPRT